MPTVKLGVAGAIAKWVEWGRRRAHFLGKTASPRSFAEN